MFQQIIERVSLSCFQRNFNVLYNFMFVWKFWKTFF